uniref:Uncharacterized protein n=1 Tax=Rhizophora mucronata TaxID=61149 RepID=A0A2P2QFW6_RHIMU
MLRVSNSKVYEDEENYPSMKLTVQCVS